MEPFVVLLVVVNIDSYRGHDYGVVGRWPQEDCDNLGYYNHMPAVEIRQRCPQFDDYTRLTAVRDPYDRAISYFHFSHPTFTPLGGMPLDEAISLLKQGNQRLLRERFVAFLRYGLPDEKALLTIDGVLAVRLDTLRDAASGLRKSCSGSGSAIELSHRGSLA